MASAYSGKVQTAAHLTDGTTDVTVDAAGGLVVLADAQHAVHAGEAFGVSHSFSGVADNSNSDFKIVVGNIEPHVTFRIAASGRAQAFLYEEANLGTDGSPVTAWNLDRNASPAIYPDMTFGYGPYATCVTDVQLASEVIPGGASVEAFDAGGYGRKLIAGATYLVRVTNQAGALSYVSVGVSGHE
jgi:hypothetical protein